ncbi:cell division protein FtsX [Sphingomonas melonis]|uniref:Cell division transport system permease protein n=1 Tax=Sphingomonas melonis TaxID=152682 RepID=A0A7Y9FJG6_9SPHN|nr:permease [Sphingomonas melonis]NYD88409.1 cell division transport system permease protein [Sphingomonas melonis]
MSGADRRVFDEAGGLRAMTWVMAIMLFLTLLAAALGLGTRQSAQALERQLAGRLTVQVVEGSPATRDALARRTLAALRTLPQVRRATLVDRAELTRTLAPWLGDVGDDADLPVPAMIDVDLTPGAAPDAVIAAAKRISAASRVDRHQRWMSPVSGFLDTLTWLAFGLVLLMLAATGAVVVLAARAGLETHRATIEVMHMLGSTDVQVARLFQRRIALDAALGGVAGGAAALAVLLFLGTRLAALGSELLGGITLDAGDWGLLVLVPVGFVALATLAARITVVAALRRSL